MAIYYLYNHRNVVLGCINLYGGTERVARQNTAVRECVRELRNVHCFEPLPGNG
jgi:hypothetical protein